MNKRSFLRRLLGGLVALPAASLASQTSAGQRERLLQESPLAGFRHYDGESLWPHLSVGDALDLRRAPDNPHDDRAVEIWRGKHMLGHLPRMENVAVAQLLDRGEPLTAHICGLAQSRNAWERIRVAVLWSPDAPAPRVSSRPTDARDAARYWIGEWRRLSDTRVSTRT